MASNLTSLPLGGGPVPPAAQKFLPSRSLTGSTQTTDPLGRTQTSTLDGLGRPTSTTGFDGATTQYGYDVLSNLTSTTDSAGGVTQQSFDHLNRRASLTDANGATTLFGWDLAGNMTSLTDSDHNSTVWAFNGLNEVTSETSPLGTRSFQFDANGNTIQEIDRNGRIRQWTYDNHDRQTSENWLAHLGSELITVSDVTHGSGGYANMVQSIMLPPALSGGTWTLSFEGQTTSPLAWNASNSDVQSALTALSTIGAGNATVTGSGSAAAPFLVTFVGAMSAGDQPLPAATSALRSSSAATVSEIRRGQPDENAVYDVQFGATYPPGSENRLGFEFNDGSQNTYQWVSIAWGSSAAQVQSDLASLGVGVASVVGTWNEFTITFFGPMPEGGLSFVGDGSETITMISPGAADAQGEEQAVNVNHAMGGTFTLSFEGATTSALAYSASAADVQAALNALPTIGAGNVTVSRSDGTTPDGQPDWNYWIEFTNNMWGAPQPLITADPSNLLAGPIQSATVAHGSSGPDTVQQIVVQALGGSFALSFNGLSTSPIPYGATASAVAAALNSLSTISHVVVTGSGTPTNPYLVTFEGAQSGADQPLLVGDSSGLSNIAATIASTFDAVGQLTSIGDSNAHYAYQYDGQGRVASVDNAGTPNVPDVVLSSQYDTLGNRTQLSATIAGVKDFLNSYSFDTLSRLTSATQLGQAGGNAVAPKGVAFSYNLDGQFTSVLRFDPTTASPHPDIAVGTMSYDTAGRLASLAYTHLGAAIDTFGYGYDSLSRVSQFSSIDGTATYGYDPTSQLTSVVYAGGGHQPANESFQFDANGNRTVANGVTQTVAAGNLVASDGTFNLFYDAEGNLVEKKRISTAPANDYDTKQSWDYRNRLIDVWQYDNSGVLTKHEHLVYDPFDRLIGREIDSTGSGTFDHTELYVYDGSDVVLQFDGAGSLTNRYLNGPSPSGADQVYAEEDVTSLTVIGTVTYPLTDQQGSGRDIVDSNGNLVDHSIFTAFGQTAFESNPAVHHLEGYAAGLPDPVTGEIHFGARNLDAVDAVWSSEDPIGLNGGDTNFRRYVGNDPTNYTDPTGLEHLPSESRGKWVKGTRGNGVFEFADTPQNRKAGTAGKQFAYKNNCIGIGGFPQKVYYKGSAVAASVQIDEVTGKNADFDAADEAMRIKRKNPKWQRPAGYTWNHAGEPGSKTMKLVEANVHRAVAHEGSASVARATARAARGAGRALVVGNVYMTARDALEAAGALEPGYEVAIEGDYYFTAEDGSIYVVQSRRLFGLGRCLTSPQRVFVAGPREGESEDMTWEDADKHVEAAEAKYGKYVPGSLFSDPKFIPGTDRKTIPIVDEDGFRTGYIDEDGPHESFRSKPNEYRA